MTEHVEAMIQCDHDDVAARGEPRSVEERYRAATSCEAAAMQPDHDGSFLCVGRRGPDIQDEAILADIL
jgi:hypothetical protein